MAFGANYTGGVPIRRDGIFVNIQLNHRTDGISCLNGRTYYPILQREPCTLGGKPVKFYFVEKERVYMCPERSWSIEAGIGLFLSICTLAYLTLF